VAVAVYFGFADESEASPACHLVVYRCQKSRFGKLGG
jgi:hypothetical protein